MTRIKSEKSHLQDLLEELQEMDKVYVPVEGLSGYYVEVSKDAFRSTIEIYLDDFGEEDAGNRNWMVGWDRVLSSENKPELWLRVLDDGSFTPFEEDT